MEYFRKGEPIPERHKALIENNLNNINRVKQTLETLSKTYNRTNNEYENIIDRLKSLNNCKGLSRIGGKIKFEL